MELSLPATLALLGQGVLLLQAAPTGGGTEQNVISLFTNLAGTISRVALPVCVVAFMVGGILYGTAAGSTRQMESGKAAMLGSAVGFAAVLLADTVLRIIQTALGTGGGGGGGITTI